MNWFSDESLALIESLTSVKPYLKHLFQFYDRETQTAIRNTGRLPVSTAAEIVTTFSADGQSLNPSRESLSDNAYEYSVAIETEAGSRPSLLNSKRDPVGRAAKEMAGFAAPARLIVLGMGLGSGHKLPHIIDGTDKGSLVLILEVSVELVYLCLEPYLLEALTRPGVHIFVPGMERELFNYIDGLPVDRFRGIRPLRDAAAMRLFPAYYNELETEVQRVFSVRMSDLLTRLEFEKRWIFNIVRNSVYLAGQADSVGPGAKKLSRAMDFFLDADSPETPALNTVAVLVSAGPSLRRSLPELEKVAAHPNSFILVVDTAYPVLKRAGIKPDGVITLDAQSHSLFHFLGTPLDEDIPLFADMVACPPLLRKAGTIISYNTAQYNVNAEGQLLREATVGMQLLEDAGIRCGDVQSGGSVATSALDLLRNMGFGSIILVGQDLAYTGREIHCTGSHHNQKWLTLLGRGETLENINEKILRKRSTREVPGIAGETVITDFVLELYANWFNDTMGTVTTDIFNATADGYRLDMPGLDGVTDFDYDKVEPAPDLKRPPGSNWAAGLGPVTGGLRDSIFSILDSLENKAEFTAEKFNELVAAEPLLENLLRKTRLSIERSATGTTDEIADKRLVDGARRHCRELLILLLKAG